MTYRIFWNEDALNAAARFLADDAAGLQHLFDVVDHLAGTPHAAGSTALGSPDLRRLKVGRYRVLYEIDQDDEVVTVIHAGRLS